MQRNRLLRKLSTRRLLSRTGAALAMLVVGTSPAAAWDSDFYETGSYIGVSGIGLFTNFGSELGQSGNRPITGITSADDSGGFRLSAGTHLNPWAALQIDFHYIAPVKLQSSTSGSHELAIYTGSITAKGYPLAKILESTLEGRLQPFVKVSPSVSGLTGSPIKTPIAFTIGVGGGTEYWITDSVTLNVEGAYWWGTASLNHLEYGTVALGAAYHF